MNRHERKVIRTDQEGNEVEYASVKEATKSITTKDLCKSIRRVCQNSTLYRGYYWRYKQSVIESEIWKDHPTLKIECSTMGRIRFRKTRVSSGGKNGVKATYLRVHVGKKWYLVHRLIAETFIPNPENKLTVDHIDRDRCNNLVENLRWYTHKEQQTNRKDTIKLTY